jgi:hypothetical protein
VLLAQALLKQQGQQGLTVSHYEDDANVVNHNLLFVFIDCWLVHSQAETQP